MEFNQILSDLKNKVYYPVYLLMGEEAYYIDVITDYIANNVLSEAEKGFNQTILYGKDTDVLSVISQAKRFPMMANYQVVILKEAQTLKNIEKLEEYIYNPLKSTILVLCYKYDTLDQRKKMVKEIKDNGVLLVSKKLYDYKIPGWINNYLRQKKYTVNPRAAQLLTEFLGTNLGKIANELDKLTLNLSPNTEITTSHVEENIGISKDFNNFELHNAIGCRNILKANQIINYFAANPNNNPFAVIMYLLYYFFSKIMSYHFITNKSKNNVASILKINPFFVRDYEVAAKNYNVDKIRYIISNLRKYDMRSKGLDNATTNDGELLKELLYKIMH